MAKDKSMVTQEEMANFSLLMAAYENEVNKNEVVLGVTVVDKNEVTGKPKFKSVYDESVKGYVQTGEPLTDENGEIVHWGNSYYLKVKAGTTIFELRATKAMFEAASEGYKFHLKGIVAVVTPESGKSYTRVDWMDITPVHTPNLFSESHD